MNLKGKQTYQASAQEIWDILMDTEKLAKITPGVSKLEKTGEDQYNAISNVKIGPVKGSFKGDLYLEDKKEPSSFTLRVKQLSKIGNADASVHIELLSQEDGQCTMAFDGKAKLSGTLARTGQRVLNGVANSLTKQFFEGLKVELEAGKVTPEPSVASAASEPSPLSTETTPADQPTGFIARLLAWLKGLFGS